MAKNNLLYLHQALDSVNNILKYTSGMDLTSFEANELVQNASIRQLEILGEAVKRLDVDFVKGHPNVGWSRIVAMRNLLIHEYDEIDVVVVWKTVVGDLPTLKRNLDEILGERGNT